MKTNYIQLASMICMLGLFFLSSCQKEELLVNENNVSYIYFQKDMTKDSTNVCFEFYPLQEGMDVQEAEVPLDVVVSGKVQDKDLEFTIGVDEKISTYPISLCTLPEKCIIKKGEFKSTVIVKVKNMPELKETSKILAVKVNESEEVREGIFYYSRALLSITDRLVKPDWWEYKDLHNGKQSSVDIYYLGEYSKTKYRLFLEVLRANDDLLFDGQDKIKLRKYSLQLKYKVQEENEKHPNSPLIDEFGMEIEIPVVG